MTPFCDVTAGEEARFNLVVQKSSNGASKPDRNGGPMYNATLDDSLGVTHYWIELAGELALIDGVIDPYGEATEIAAIHETRAIQTEWGAGRDAQTSFSIRWGTDAKATRIVEVVKGARSLFRTAASWGKLVDEKLADEKDAVFTTRDYPLHQIGLPHTERGLWRNRYLNVGEHDDYLDLSLPVSYHTGPSTTASHSFELLWGELPSWVQQPILAHYPVCGCGRSRYPRSDKQQVCGWCKNDKRRATEAARPKLSPQAAARQRIASGKSWSF